MGSQTSSELRSANPFERGRSRPSSPHNVSTPTAWGGSTGFLSVPGRRGRGNLIEDDEDCSNIPCSQGETMISTTNTLSLDPSTEVDFEVENNPFAFTPGQLRKLYNPKSLGAFRALGGLEGLEKGLKSDRMSGLSLDEQRCDGCISFEENEKKLDQYSSEFIDNGLNAICDIRFFTSDAKWEGFSWPTFDSSHVGLPNTDWLNIPWPQGAKAWLQRRELGGDLNWRLIILVAWIAFITTYLSYLSRCLSRHQAYFANDSQGTELGSAVSEANNHGTSHNLQTERSRRMHKSFLQILSLVTRLLNRAPTRLVLSGALLCLSGKANALDTLDETTRDGYWDIFIRHVIPIGVIATAYHECILPGGLPYLMGALSLSWPIIKTNSRSSVPLIYGVYLAHLVTTATYSYVSFRDHHEPRRPLLLSVLLCAGTSLLILFWSPTGAESLLTFLPPVLSLSVFIVANASLIGSMLRSLVECIWQRLCHLVRYCFDCLGGGVQSVGQLLQRARSGRDGDEESLFAVASA
ncbi:hypothetical protein P171DRAFT_265413 [Karstenula rhodostoma CBS 690.94]|uniref:Transmembrane protein n=1 Tax=Karstenula rhodostoma CBS 690.94 TaxID=1392251 RepID=A0A9P4PI11_9PLEO|nr:hypothetical protein P171DRAFT_265413 [Karstenula rhodostoma CBS 690.94]